MHSSSLVERFRRGCSRARSLTLLLALEAAAHAEPASAARVVVTASGQASALVREAMVRAEGELRAGGLHPEVYEAGARPKSRRGAASVANGVYGMLDLEVREGMLVIHAWAPGAPAPLDARVELTSPNVTAEVIAVRAVETLRAAMLQFAQTERGEVPNEVRAFTRFSAAPAAVAGPLAATPPLVPPLAFWAGAQAKLHAGAPPDWGAEVGLLVGPPSAFAGVAVETTVGRLRLEGEHGGADVRRQAAWLELGARFRARSSWEVSTRAAVGYAAFHITGQGEAGYRGGERMHGSPAFLLGVGSSYWLTRSLGLYANASVRLATDAPTIFIAGERTVTLERPSFVLSLGATVGVF